MTNKYLEKIAEKSESEKSKLNRQGTAAFNTAVPVALTSIGAGAAALPIGVGTNLYSTSKHMDKVRERHGVDKDVGPSKGEAFVRQGGKGILGGLAGTAAGALPGALLHRAGAKGAGGAIGRAGAVAGGVYGAYKGRKSSLKNVEKAVEKKAFEQGNPYLEKIADKLKGGEADNTPNQAFDPEELAEGIEVELEHTDDIDKAIEIAKDHLKELPDYYSRLEEMEEEGKNELGIKKED